MHKQKLIPLSLHDGRLFYCLEEIPVSSHRDEAVVFLHGLGENRAGLNYLFRELSEGLRRAGYTIYRFDLGGCGESSLPLSLATWKEQLASLLKFIASYKAVHLVARGTATVLLSQGKGRQIAIGPVIDTLFKEQLPQIIIHKTGSEWVTTRRGQGFIKEESFWYSLGVEAGSLFWGPFRALMSELKEEVIPIPKQWDVIIGGSATAPLLKQACHLPECHPLFLYQADRQILLKEIAGILND